MMGRRHFLNKSEDLPVDSGVVWFTVNELHLGVSFLPYCLETTFATTLLFYLFSSDMCCGRLKRFSFLLVALLHRAHHRSPSRAHRGAPRQAWFLLPVVVFSVLGATISAKAQTDTVSIEGVEVKSVRTDALLHQPAPTQQMTVSRIASIPAASIAEAVRNFTGAVVKDFGGVGGLKTVMVRSLGANHTAVFYDGLPLTEAATGQIDLGKVSLHNIANIRLTVGDASVGLKPARMYASASLLEISSAQTARLEKLTWQAYTRTGSFGIVNPGFYITAPITKKASTGLHANFYTAHGRYPYEINNGTLSDRLTRENSDMQSIELTSRSNVILPDSSLLHLKVSYTASNRGLPGAVIFYNMHSRQRLQNKELNAGLTYSNHPKARLRLSTSGGFSHSRLLYRDPAFLNNQGGLRNTYNQSEAFLSQSALSQLTDWLTVSLASDIIYNTLNTNAYAIETPRRVSSLTALTANARHRNSELHVHLLFTAVADVQQATNKSHLRLSPAVSFMQGLTADGSLKLRALFKNIYRLPGFNDLYYFLAGNINLKPEDASLYNLGIVFTKDRWQNTSLSFTADCYLNRVTNKIVTVPTQNLFIWSTRNIGISTIRGIELQANLSQNLSKNWSMSLGGNYTYQDALDKTNKDAASYNQQLPYIPFETAGGLLAVNYRDISAGINTLFNGYRYVNSVNSNENLLPAWSVTDVTLGYRKTLSTYTITAKLEMANIFNLHYEVVRGFPMSGRAYFINLTIQH